eukprot:3931733-Rhodomonas_salina.3
MPARAGAEQRKLGGVNWWKRWLRFRLRRKESETIFVQERKSRHRDRLPGYRRQPPFLELARFLTLLH